MARNRRTFTKEFKLGILAEIDAGATIAQMPLVSTASIPKPFACGGGRSINMVIAPSPDTATHTPMRRASLSSSVRSAS